MTTDVIERSAPVADTPSRKPPLIAEQLLQQGRKDGRFIYPTTFDLGYGSAEQRQHFAIHLLLSCAREFAANPMTVMTRRELQAERAKLEATEENLRETAARGVVLGLRKPRVLDTRKPDTLDTFFNDPLITAVEAIEDMIATLETSTIVIERIRGDRREQAVTIRVAGLCNILFGKVMRVGIASLVSELFGSKIEPHTVRNWWNEFTRAQ
jgi:hypothetical protein